MAASQNATPDVTAFVSTFTRKPLPTAEPGGSSEANLSSATDLPRQASPVSESIAPTLKVERSEDTNKQTERREVVSAEQAGRINYAATFLTPVRGRKLKAVYMDEDTHNALAVITQASDGTPLADLLINIIKQHFETYGPDIRAFVNEQEKKNKKRLPY
ncbi:DUF3408 domain-containing protein [Hymenobacter sp. YC55]|uniref:DUF3408 domain-containing protein n=1 Tax=Hymenobacter sp. YC55 TaxID=3034019 RepID=UPI0023F73C3A|nr:DUF3408 domain-containing protein [Hymenobacter sp. YC55]MDF7815110.1 DUF3408 domain-containing protein [Hymenobacter sp. YC55]